MKEEIIIDILAVTFMVISIVLFITTIILIFKLGWFTREPQKKNVNSKQEKNTADEKNKAAGEVGSVVINLVISPNHYYVTVPEEDLENNFYNDRFKGYED